MEIHFCMQIQKVRRRTLFCRSHACRWKGAKRNSACGADLDSMFFKGFEVPPRRCYMVNMQMFERENSIGCNHSWGLLFAARVRRLPLNFVCARAHTWCKHTSARGIWSRWEREMRNLITNTRAHMNEYAMWSSPYSHYSVSCTDNEKYTIY